MIVNTFTLKDYDGGLNNSSNPLTIARNEASVLTNWDISVKGKLTRRDGLTEIGVFNELTNNTDTITLTDDASGQVFDTVLKFETLYITDVPTVTKV
jgi:hypothetical protein